MVQLSFRFKLLLAMMLLVASITWAAMYLAQSRLQAAFDTLFDLEFQSEVALFSQSQEARLGALKEQCANFVRKVRILALVEEVQKNPEESTEELYDTARDELKLQGTRASMTFIRFLTGRGEVIPMPNLPLERNQMIADLVKPAAATLDNPEQEIGYLPLPEMDGTYSLQEVIITKIVDDDEIIGAMLLATPFVESRTENGVDFDTGVIVSGQVFSMAVPPGDREKLLGLARASSGMTREVLELGGTPHSVSFRALNEDSHLPPATHVAIHSMADAVQQQMELRQLVLALGASAMAVALIIGIVLSHSLTGPVQDLVRATQQIQQGNYKVAVPVRSRDEIGQLAGSFNEMARGLEMKEKYRSVLDIVADKGIAEELMKGTIALGGEERVVSVLFCDIRGFTALTEKMKPPEVIHMLNEHFTPLTRVVYEHDGVVDKFVGDLIMAIFGAPKSSGRDAENAVRCALAMLQERALQNETSRQKIRMGIGIATGRVVAGRMGSSDRMNYTVLGPKVNLASRLCSQAGVMEVVIDAETLESVKDIVQADPLPEMKLKGFAELVKAWKVTAKI